MIFRKQTINKLLEMLEVKGEKEYIKYSVAIMEYGEFGVDPTLEDGLLSSYDDRLKWDGFKISIDSDNKKREAKIQQCSEAGKKHSGNQYTRMKEKTQSRDEKIEAAKKDIKNYIETLKTTVVEETKPTVEEIKKPVAETENKEKTEDKKILDQKQEWLVEDFFTLFTDYFKFKGTLTYIRNDFINMCGKHDMNEVFLSAVNYASICNKKGFYPEFCPTNISHYASSRFFEECKQKNFNSAKYVSAGEDGYIPRDVFDREGYCYDTKKDKHGNTRADNRYHNLLHAGCPHCGNKSSTYRFDSCYKVTMCKNCGAYYEYERKTDKIIERLEVLSTNLTHGNEYKNILFGEMDKRLIRISDGVKLSREESDKIIAEAWKEHDEMEALLPPPREIFADVDKISERYLV